MFYDQFAKLCSIRGVSRTKACIDCGVSRTAWHKWESGATPNGATINKFSAYFGVPVGQLLGENEKTPTLTAKDERNDSMENKLIELYRELNEEGQEKLIDYADDMVRSGKYIKTDEIIVDKEA